MAMEIIHQDFNKQIHSDEDSLQNAWKKTEEFSCKNSMRTQQTSKFREEHSRTFYTNSDSSKTSVNRDVSNLSGQIVNDKNNNNENSIVNQQQFELIVPNNSHNGWNVNASEVVNEDGSNTSIHHETCSGREDFHDHGHVKYSGEKYGTVTSKQDENSESYSAQAYTSSHIEGHMFDSRNSENNECEKDRLNRPRISVDISPTHNAFARSLRTISPISHQRRTSSTETISAHEQERNARKKSSSASSTIASDIEYIRNLVVSDSERETVPPRPTTLNLEPQRKGKPPLKRTDTYDERCRQLLGLNQENIQRSSTTGSRIQTRKTQSKSDLYQQSSKSLKESNCMISGESLERRKSTEKLKEYPAQKQSSMEKSTRKSTEICEDSSQIRRSHESSKFEFEREQQHVTESVTTDFGIQEYPAQIRRTPEPQEPLEPCPEKKKVLSEPSTLSEYPAQIRRESPERQPLEPYPEKHIFVKEPPTICEFPAQIRRTPEPREPVEAYPEKKKLPKEPPSVNEYPAQFRRPSPEREPLEPYPAKVKVPKEPPTICEFPAQIRRTPEPPEPVEPYPEKRKIPKEPPSVNEFPAQIRRPSPEREPLEPYPEKLKVPKEPPTICEFPPQIRRKSPEREPLQPYPKKERVPKEPPSVCEFPAQIRRTPEPPEPVEPYPEKKRIPKEPPSVNEFPAQFRRPSPEREPLEPYPAKVKVPKEPPTICEFPAQIRRTPEPPEPVEPYPEKKKMPKEPPSVNEFPAQIRRPSPEREPLEPYPEKLKVPKEPPTICEFPSQIRRKSPEREPTEPYPEKKKIPKEPPSVNEFPAQIRRPSPEREPLEPYPEKLKVPKEPPTICEFPSQIRRKSPEREPIEPYSEKKRVAKEPPNLSEFPAQIRRSSPDREPLEPYPAKQNVPKEPIDIQITESFHIDCQENYNTYKEFESYDSTVGTVKKSETMEQNEDRTPVDEPPFIKKQISLLYDNNNEKETILKTELLDTSAKVQNSTVKKQLLSTPVPPPPPVKNPVKNPKIQKTTPSKPKPKEQENKTGPNHIVSATITITSSKKGTTKPEPKKSTKNDDLNREQMVTTTRIDLQRSKSSRDPSPDRLCPLPLTENDQNTISESHPVRYPDSIMEPEESHKEQIRSHEVIQEIEDLEEHELLRTTSMITNLSEGDECLMTVLQKVNKFSTATAEKLPSPKTPINDENQLKCGTNENVKKTLKIFETPRKSGTTNSEVRKKLIYPEHPDSRSRSLSPDGSEDLPGYMKPLDRRLRPNSPHRESISKLPYGLDDEKTEEPNEKITKFGVTLRRTQSSREPRQKSTSKYHQRKESIEEIYDLSILREMLESAIGYETRRRIRNQISVIEEQVGFNVNKALDSNGKQYLDSNQKKSPKSGILKKSLESLDEDRSKSESKTEWIKRKIFKKITPSNEKSISKPASDFNKKTPSDTISKSTITTDQTNRDRQNFNVSECNKRTRSSSNKSKTEEKSLVKNQKLKDEEQQRTSSKQSFVRTLSKKFIGTASDESTTNKEKQMKAASYPKAGLILRTSSFKKTHNENADNRSNGTTITKTEMGKSKKLNSSNGGTFLTNKTKVTGLKDAISRMGRTSNITEVENSTEVETENARNLLNKFLGSQVILSGIESIRSTSSKHLESFQTGKSTDQVPLSAGAVVPFDNNNTNSTVRTTKITLRKTESGKLVTKTFIFEHPIQEQVLETVQDEEILKQLLEQSSEYEERRRIRTRLQQIMSQQEEIRKGKSLNEETDEEAGRPLATTSQVTTKTEGATSSCHKMEVSISAKTSSTTMNNNNHHHHFGSTKPLSPFDKFRQLDKQASLTSPTSTPRRNGSTTTNACFFKFTDPAVCHGASTVKERLLHWCRMKTKEYENVQLDNFSGSWADGLAFCALIHHFLPDAFDYNILTAKNRRYNFTLAFKVADEKADIAPLLDVDDMVACRRPDWKCVFTYVQSIYRRFKDED